MVSFLGIFKSGNFYVPLDVKSPIERTLKILEALIQLDNDGYIYLSKSDK